VTTIGVVAAMPSEMKPFAHALGLRAETRDGLVLRVGALPDGGPDVVATVVGIGPVSARASTKRLLAACTVDRVVMIGIAGGLDPGLGIGDLVAPEVVVDEATGAEFRPGPLGDLVFAGRMLTASELIMDPARHDAFRADGVVALDMETAAVGSVCEDNGVPWSVVRAISDRPSDGLVDAGMLNLTRPDGTPNLPAVARLLLRRPWRIVKLSRLARDSTAASKASADAAIRALRS
jgi:adenosylhomocysteine nucleosidase